MSDAVAVTGPVTGASTGRTTAPTGLASPGKPGLVFLFERNGTSWAV